VELLPISTWDGYTIFVILSTIIVSTIFMGFATKRVCQLQINANSDEEIRKYRLNTFEKLCLLVSFFSVVIVAGLQMSNSDYESYKALYLYEYSKTYNFFQLEGLFRAINKFVYDYLDEFQFVILIVSFITNIFMFRNVLYYSLRSKVNPKCALFIYLCMYMLVSFGMLRQICAASIVIFSLRYIQKKQYFKYAFFTVLALGFHATAIISVPLLFFSAMNVKTKGIKLIYRITIVIAFYFVAIFSNQILAVLGELLGRTTYSNYYAVESVGLGNIVYRIPILIFLLAFGTIIKKAPLYVRVFSGLVLFEVLLCFTYYFIPMLGGRLQYYIIFGYAIVIPYCIHNINSGKNGSPILTGIIVYGYGFYYLFNQLLTTEWITKYLMPISFFEF
jgi:hypothetical protein